MAQSIKKAVAPKAESAAKEADGEAQVIGLPQEGGGTGLQVMKDDDINKYMEELLKSNDPGLEGLELNALNNFKAISREINNGSQRLAALRRDADQLDNTIKRLQGQLDAYVNLLVGAEDARRASAD